MRGKGIFIFLLYSLCSFSQTNTDSLKRNQAYPNVLNNIIIYTGYGKPSYIIFHDQSKPGFTDLHDRGAFYLRCEYSNRKDPIVTIGLNIFYSQAQYKYNQAYGVQGFTGTVPITTVNNIGVGVRFNSYIITNATFALYIALGFGGQFFLNNQSNPVYGEAFLGARLMIIENLGLFAEVGAGKTLGQAGLAFRI